MSDLARYKAQLEWQARQMVKQANPLVGLARKVAGGARTAAKGGYAWAKANPKTALGVGLSITVPPWLALKAQQYRNQQTPAAGTPAAGTLAAGVGDAATKPAEGGLPWLPMGIGAGAGALGGGLLSELMNDPNDPESRKNRMSNSLISILGGAGLGAGGGYLYDMLNKPATQAPKA